MTAVLAIAGVSALPLEGVTQEGAEPSAASGLKLANRLCQGCHAIAEGARASSVVGIPTFRSIANQPGQTGERIKGILIKPHKPMPDMHLTNEEILDLLAYFQSLQTDNSAPPLLPPTHLPPKSGPLQPS